MYAQNEKLIPVYIEDEMKNSYITYAMSVIVGRALPDVRDGLKPVHRRILYAMKELNLEHNKPYKKSARITGEVLGKFHPHGDTAVYDSLVRMVQKFSLRYPLIDGQGNFGCFTKDTKIKLADGRDLSFGELIEEERENKINYTYTFNSKTKRIEIAQIKKPRLTKKKTELVKVVLDDGEEIRCTPNHRFMLRSGAYKEAQYLAPGDALMPLYRKLSTEGNDPNIAGYEMIYQPGSDQWDYTHRLTDEWNIKHGVYLKNAGRIRHHIDFNKLNNNPENIRRYAWGEHWKVHCNMTSDRHRNDPEYIQKLARGRNEYWNKKGIRKKYSSLFTNLNRKNWRNPKYRKKMIEAVKKKWEDPEFKQYMIGLFSERLKRLWKRPGFRQWRGRLKSEELKAKWRDESYAAYMAEVMRRRSIEIWKDPEHRKHMTALNKKRWLDHEYKTRMSEKSKKQWENSDYKKYMTACYKRKWQDDISFRGKFIPILTENGRKAHYYRFLKVCEKIVAKQKDINAENYEKERHDYGSRRGEGIVRYEKGLRKYFNGDISGIYEELKRRAGEVRLNHKVVRVEKISQKEDVYDLTIERTHNFTLARGVFVHNSVDGDAAAAMRYTECRLAAIADELLSDIDKDTVEFTPNFDETLQEPTVLPSRLPNLLVNGSSGIAVGMATNIPPHNLTEIVDAVVKVISEPDVSIKDLMKIVKGPDFPTGGVICGRDGIREAYEKGRGLLKVHAKAAVESQKGNREAIVITEIPYQVNKSKLIENIANLVQDKKIEGISDIRDESDKEGMRVVIDLKRDQNAQVILNQLYKRTQMETTFGIIMLALVDNKPKVLNLKEVLELYIKHRQEIVRRRTQFELNKAERRAHILEGLKIAIDNLSKIIKIIRESKDPNIAKTALMKNFDLSEVQAQAILEMQLQRLTALERNKIDKEYLELIKKIEMYKSILRSEKKILEIVENEALEVKKKYGDERQTDIVAKFEEMEVEDLIAEEDMVITISHAGYIKRLPIGSYRRQRRGGTGVTGIDMKDEDFVEHLFIASTHEYILFFTNQGRVHWLKVYEIPQASSRAAKGKAIVNLLQLSQGESVSSYVRVKEFKEGSFLVMATKNGLIKKTDLMDYSNPRKGGIIGITIEKGDELIEVELTDGKQEMLLATNQGKAIRFSESQVRDMGRSAKGVRGIRLAKKDIVIAMALATKDSTFLTVTSQGFAKRTAIDQYRKQSRGGKGIKNVSVTKKNGEAVGLKTVTDKDEIMVMTGKGMIVRCAVKDIRITGRSTQGVRIIKLDSGDRAASVARVVPEEEESVPIV